MKEMITMLFIIIMFVLIYVFFIGYEVGKNRVLRAFEHDVEKGYYIVNDGR